MLNTENCLYFYLKAWIEFNKININFIDYLIMARNCTEHSTYIISLHSHNQHIRSIIILILWIRKLHV